MELSTLNISENEVNLRAPIPLQTNGVVILVLGRRENQSIRIHTADGIIEILITQLDDRLVKLGFDAPASVKILRSEIDPSADNYLPPLNPEKLKHFTPCSCRDRGVL